MYERRGDVGGLWNFDEDPGQCVISNASKDRVEPGYSSVQPASYATNLPGHEFEKSAMYEGLRYVRMADAGPTSRRYDLVISLSGLNDLSRLSFSGWNAVVPHAR